MLALLEENCQNPLLVFRIDQQGLKVDRRINLSRVSIYSVLQQPQSFCCLQFEEECLESAVQAQGGTFSFPQPIADQQTTNRVSV